MEAFERIAVVMALMRQLEQVLEQEVLVLREMRLDRLKEIVTEKTRLGQAYESELRALRGEPELLASLDPVIRSELERAMRRFAGTAATNLRALEAARDVVERVMRHIGASLEAAPFRPRLYHDRNARKPVRGQVIALAINHQI